MLSFDVRTKTHKDIVRAVEVGENEAKMRLGAPVNLQITWTGPTTFTADWVASPMADTAQLAKFDRALAKAVVSINQQQAGTMSITGATLLGDQFRSQLAGVKQKLAKATGDMTKAMTELSDTADQAGEAVKQVVQETADLKSALGLNTNNPPAGAKN